MTLSELQQEAIKDVTDDLETIKNMGRICSATAVKIILKYWIKQPNLQKVIDELTRILENYKTEFNESDRIMYLNQIVTANRFTKKLNNTYDVKERKIALKNGDTDKWNALNDDETMRRNILHKNKMCRCFRHKS